MFLQTGSLLNLVRCLHFWNNEAVIENDHQGQESNNETRIPNPQSCAGFVIWHSQPAHQNPNQICWHQKPTRRLTHQSKLHTWWVSNLLHLFNISNFSSASCTEAMSKRMQQGTGEERIVAKSKPTLNLDSHTAASSSTAPSSSAPSRPGILRAPTQQGSDLTAQSAGKLVAEGSNQNDAASSSQVWLTDTQMSERARKLAAAGTNQDPSFQERARKLAAGKFRHQRRGRLEVAAPLPHISC